MKFSKNTPQFDKYFPRFLGMLFVSIILWTAFSIKIDNFMDYTLGAFAGLSLMEVGYFLAKMDSDK